MDLVRGLKLAFTKYSVKAEIKLPVAQMVKSPSTNAQIQVRALGQEDPLEEGMAAHSSILAWKSHGQRILEGYSPQGCKELDMTE